MTKKQLHVRKGDKVVVISGAYKSDQPREVIQVMADEGRVIVQGVNMRWKHERRSQRFPQGAREQREFPIDASNVALFSEKAGKGVRTRTEVVEGKRVRVGKACGTKFD